MTPATITVNFISNYTGPHRVCWRIQGSGNPYVCTNIVDCLGGGNNCQAVINTMVDSESCDTTIFEGYIQATCNAEGSATGQVPFTVTYVSDPSCKAYLLINETGSPAVFTSADLGVNCDGSIRAGLTLADTASFYLCGIAGMPTETIEDYNVALASEICCSKCRTYQVSSATPGDIAYYLDCTTKQILELVLTTLPVSICAVENSVTAANTIILVAGNRC